MYATLADLISQYGLTEISQLLDDEEGNLSAALLDATINGGDTSAFSADEVAAADRAVTRADSILAQTSRIIDASVGAVYPVPLTTDIAAATPVQTCCMAIARAALADDGDNLADSTRADRDYWRAWLRDVAHRVVVIPGLAPIASGGVSQQRLSGSAPSSVDWNTY